MRAWWAYWLTIGVAAVVWVGVGIAAPPGGLRAILDEPLWMILLLAPLVGAGLNLIIFRDTHEEICRIEVGRHRSLRFLVGPGYSARTFPLIGLGLLGLVGLVLTARLGDRV